MLTADCFPITVAPGLHRLFLDYCAGDAAVGRFYASLPPDAGWQVRPPVPHHWPELVALLAEQNPTPQGSAAAGSLEALRQGAGAVVTGQQVGLFGGPLFTPFKAATAVARARQATTAGRPHTPIFWLASEDHDFAEINHVVFPAARELRKLTYEDSSTGARPVGGIVLDERITPLIDQAWELLGSSDAMEALVAAYKPGRTFAQAFHEFYAKAFAAQGLLVLDAAGRAVHRMGAPVLRAGLERADELHAALLERNRELETAGYHAQVAVGAQSSLLFLIDEKTGAIQIFGVRRVTWRIDPFVPLPDLGARFDCVTSFMVCFNRHIQPDIWKAEEWRFFLDDLWTRLKPGAIVWFELNPTPDGTHYTPELQAFFESRGAIVDGKRLVWGLSETEYRVLLDLGRLESASVRKATGARSSSEGEPAAAS